MGALKPQCETCRHWRPPDFPDMRNGDCTLHPVWVVTEPVHYCGQYAPGVAAVNAHHG